MTTTDLTVDPNTNNLGAATELDDLDDGLQDDPPAPQNLFGNVYEFVEFIAALYAHEVSDQQTHWRWCSHWFHHTEAVARLEACWKAFEVLRLDPGTGASVWFRDHADPCMTALTNPGGPGAGVKPRT